MHLRFQINYPWGQSWNWTHLDQQLVSLIIPLHHIRWNYKMTRSCSTANAYRLQTDRERLWIGNAHFTAFLTKSTNFMLENLKKWLDTHWNFRCIVSNSFWQFKLCWNPKNPKFVDLVRMTVQSYSLNRIVFERKSIHSDNKKANMPLSQIYHHCTCEGKVTQNLRKAE